MLISETQTLTGAIASLNAQGIMGLITTIPKLLIGLIAMGTEMGLAGLKAIGFSRILNTLNITPVMFALSLLTYVIGGAIAAYNAFTVTTEEHAEDLAKVGQEYSDLTSKLQSINSELDTTKQRIKELESKDSLTIVEQDELQKLKETNVELERQNALTERSRKLKGQEVSKEFAETVESFRNEKGKGLLQNSLTFSTNLNVDTLDYYYQEYLRYQDKIKNAGSYEDDSFYEEKLKTARDEINKLYTATSEYVESLEGIDYEFLSDDAKKSYDYYFDIGNKNLLTTEDATENIQTVFDSIFNYGKYSEANKALSDLGETGELTAEKIQELYNSNGNVKEMINYLAELGLVDLSDSKIMESFEGLANQLNESKNEVEEWSSVSIEDFDKLAEKIDNIQKAFETATNAIKEYNENGYLSIDNLQALLTLDDKYLNALIDENGQLLTNADAYKTLMQAELDELELQQIKAIIDNITGLTKESAEAYAAAQAIDTKNQSHEQLIETLIQEAYVQAAAKDAEEGTTAYTQALQAALPTMAKRIALIRSASDAFGDEKTSAKDALETEKKALEDSKKAWEDKLSAIEDAKGSIQDLIDLVIDMITKEKELQKESLQEQKEDFDDLIDKRKELLEIAKEENDFNKELSERQNTVAQNALSAAVASLDDSSGGKKAQKEANDNLADSRADLTDYLNDHEYDIRIDKLDKLKEANDEFYDKQIEAIDEYLDNERKLYEDACARIDNDNGALYGQLLSYVRTYTTQSDSEFQHLWSNAQTALRRYGGENIAVASLMNNLNGQIYIIQGTIDDLSIKINNTSTAIENLSSSLGNNLANGITNAKISLEEYEEVLSKLQEYYNNNPKPTSKPSSKQGTHDKTQNNGDLYKNFMDAYTSAPHLPLPHYAKGTKYAQGGLSVIDEEGIGTETVLPKLDNGRYAMLPQGSSVFTKSMTEELFNFASDPESYLSKAYDSVLENLMSSVTSNNTIEAMFGKIPDIPMNISTQNTSNTISPVIQIYIQGDATQSTVKALHAEADKIADKAAKKVMNIALKNKNII